VIDTKGGNFTAQGDTSVEFTEDNGHIRFQTIKGQVSMNLTGSSTGWRGTILFAGVEHWVWFWPEENHLSLTEPDAPGNTVHWDVTMLAASG
jgi:hypothetical protein